MADQAETAVVTEGVVEEKADSKTEDAAVETPQEETAGGTKRKADDTPEEADSNGEKKQKSSKEAENEALKAEIALLKAQIEDKDEKKKAALAAAAALVPSGVGPANPNAALAATIANASSMPPSFLKLPISVQMAFQSVFAQGLVTVVELDASVFDSLCDFVEQTALTIVESFSRADLTSIRNRTGYLIGILKQYRRKGEGLKRNAGAAGAQQQMYGGAQQYGMYAQPQYGYAAYGMGAGMPGMGAGMGAAGMVGAAGLGSAGMGAMAGGVMPPAASPYGAAPAVSVTIPHIAALPHSVQARFDAIWATGTCAPADLETSIFDSLKDFDEYTQCAIVDKFSRANLSTVRNKTGYFIGILKVYRQGGGGMAPAMGGGGMQQNTIESYAPADIVGQYGAAATGSFPSFHKMPQPIQIRFQDMYNSGILQPGDIEDSVFDSLNDFDETQAMSMVDSFAGTDLVQIRNKTAFFIGILKRNRTGGH